MVRDKVTRQCPQPTTFVERKNSRLSRRGIEPKPLLLTCLSDALPLGQTGNTRCSISGQTGSLKPRSVIVGGRLKWRWIPPSGRPSEREREMGVGGWRGTETVRGRGRLRWGGGERDWDWERGETETGEGEDRRGVGGWGETETLDGGDWYGGGGRLNRETGGGELRQMRWREVWLLSWCPTEQCARDGYSGTSSASHYVHIPPKKMCWKLLRINPDCRTPAVVSLFDCL